MGSLGERRVQVTLILRGPVLTRSTAAGAYGVDAPVARDGEGRPILPGTLVKGRLRESWEELSRVPGDPLGLGARLPRWLGVGEGAAGGASAAGTRRGRLLISDFRADDGDRVVRHRIQVDPELGAVRPHAFQTVETPFAAGEEVSFRGEVRFVPRDRAELDALTRCLEAGLRWIPAFGALRSVGFGRLVAAEVEPVRAEEEPAPASGAAGTPPRDRASAEAAEDRAADGVLELAFTPEAPFCVSRPQPVENLFESAVVLPGATLKGALASSWRELLGLDPDGAVTDDLDPDRPELCGAFSRLRFTHAFPALRDDLRRPVTPPLSLVQTKAPLASSGEGEGEEEPAASPWTGLRDVLLCSGPGLLRTVEGWRAPAFAPDWKGRRAVDEAFGWPSLDRELRVRTAIDSQTLRAEAEQLFGLETVLPRDEVVWLGRLDLGGDVEPAVRGKVQAQLEDLLARLGGALRGVGKTKVRVGVEVLSSAVDDAIPRRQGDSGGAHAVLLQTPALLAEPARIRQSPGAEGLHAAYGAVWDELSSGSLRLVRFFAAQELAGGEYLWRQFQKGRDYEPYLLTSAGSVFLLEPVAGLESQAQETLDGWARRGLPVPRWAMERFAPGADRGELWARCPYLPENGYGEVLLDREVHWRLRPGAEDFRALDAPGGPAAGAGSPDDATREDG